MDACGAVLSNTPLYSDFNTFTHKCNSAAVEATTDGCTFTNALPIIGKCLTSTMDTGTFCSGDCFRQADTFLSQCEDSGGMIRNFIPQLRAAVDSCAAPASVPVPGNLSPPPTVKTCDVDKMNQICDGFTIASPDELCKSPCMELIVESYDTCAQDPNVNDSFLKDLQPYVFQCEGDSTTGCDVAAMNAACINFTPPEDGNLETLCDDPCISDMVDHYDSCAAIPEMSEFVQALEKIVTPCQSKGEERDCYNLLDHFHHNSEAQCCSGGDCSSAMPDSCSSECAE
jgi:hypothetical protein